MGKDDKGETVLFVRRGDSKVALRFDQNAVKVADPNGGSTVPKDDRTKKAPGIPGQFESHSYLQIARCADAASPVTRVLAERLSLPDRSKKSACFEATASGSPIAKTPRRRSRSPQVKLEVPSLVLTMLLATSRQRHRMAGSQCPYPFRVVPLEDQSSPQLRPISLNRDRTGSGDSAASTSMAADAKQEKKYALRPLERRAEHDKFLRGLNLFGKDWKKLSAYIGARAISCRRALMPKVL